MPQEAIGLGLPPPGHCFRLMKLGQCFLTLPGDKLARFCQDPPDLAQRPRRSRRQENGVRLLRVAAQTFQCAPPHFAA